MKSRMVEGTAAALVAAALLAAVVVPLRLDATRRAARAREVRTIELTGVMSQGVWTDEAVTASNAWRRDFRKARPVLKVGETVRLRLASADVIHAFALPALGVDPTEIYPGKVVELLVTPTEAGLFEYYCTTVCGEPHFAMRGFIEVRGVDAPAHLVPPTRPGAAYWLTPEPAVDASRAAQGRWLFRQQGCVTCHGEGGAAGVPNPNSMNPAVPAIADLARRTFLFSPPDVEAFGRLLEEHPGLDGVDAAPEVPLFAVVKRQYLTTRKLVRDGRRSSPLDPAGPRPPLDMPAWGARLSDAQIEVILIYLLTDGSSMAAARPATTDPTYTKE